MAKELSILLVAKNLASKTINQVSKDLGKLNKAGNIASRGLSNAGRNIERGLIIGAGAAAAGITYAVKSAIDWESAMTGVNKTIDTTPAKLKEIEAGLIALSNRTPTSAVELAAIAENAGALGIPANDILAFTETVALIGSTTNVSTDEASTALGQLGNVLRLTGDDYDNFAATLVDLGNKGASTEAQILEIARRSGSAASLIGVAKNATLGWASAAANLGMNEELAGTSLQNLYLKSMPLFMEAGEEMQTIMGKTAAQLEKSFDKDAGGTLETFMKRLGAMPKDARLEAVKKLFGKGSGLTRLILGLADSYDRNLGPSLDTATSAWEKNTAATAEAAKRYATTESQLAILKNNVTNAAVTIGANLLPLVNELASSATGWIQTHQDEIKQFGVDLAAGIKEAVTWTKSLNWDAITASLQMAAGFAKTLIGAFTSMPPWIQAAVLSGWGFNKLTGGALNDMVGLALSSTVKMLGIKAGIVNVSGAVVKTPGGLPGGGGGGVPNVLPAAGATAAGGLLGPGLLVAAAMAMAPIVAFQIIPRLVSAMPGFKPGFDQTIAENKNPANVVNATWATIAQNLGQGGAIAQAVNRTNYTIASKEWRPVVNVSTGFTVSIRNVVRAAKVASTYNVRKGTVRNTGLMYEGG